MSACVVRCVMHPDDKLALLVAVHHAAGDGYAPEACIRVALGGRRLRGALLSAGLRRLHAEGLVLPALRRGWTLTGAGWAQVVNGMTVEPEVMQA